MQRSHQRTLRLLAGLAITAFFAVATPVSLLAYGTHPPQGYLGVETRDLTVEEVTTLKLKEMRGVEIINVDHDGPACKAGMRIHDVLLQMDGQRIDGEEQLRKVLKDLPPGRNVTFVVSRDGQTQSFTMQTADRKMVGIEAWGQHYSVPAPEPAYVPHNSFAGTSGNSAGSAVTTPKGHRDLFSTNVVMSASFTGAELEVMGGQLATYFGAENGSGLLVRSVGSGTPAEAAGMKAGDVVVRVNAVPITTGDEWTRTVHENRGRQIPVDVIRDHHLISLTLIPDNKKRSSLVPSLGLEQFFESTGQETHCLLARL